MHAVSDRRHQDTGNKREEKTHMALDFVCRLKAGNQGPVQDPTDIVLHRYPWDKKRALMSRLSRLQLELNDFPKNNQRLVSPGLLLFVQSAVYCERLPRPR